MKKKEFVVRELSCQERDDLVTQAIVNEMEACVLSSLYELGRLVGRRVTSIEKVDTKLGDAHVVSCGCDREMQILEEYLLPVE